MAQKMTQEEWRAFVSHSTRTGKLSTVRADGSPHIAPIWFVLDGDSFVFNTGADTVKGRNLARDGRVALCVDDDRPPFSYVVLQGRAEISGHEDDPEGLLHWATRIGARYMGEERGEAFGRRNGVPGELLVRVPIDKVIAMAGIAD
ncbi:PPOX class F420-dependent oxidoreductase [Streptomyces sp. NPDC048606]|uniref:PPOX class F420-dependent oxidoreductase n=1 Tax=Streptomyces sp. NPDC048606 TaxID=3154726 RepID=UPI00343E3793